MHKCHAALGTVYKVATQGIDDHEDQLVKWGPGLFLHRIILRVLLYILILRKSWHKRFIWEKARREDQNRDWDQEVCECEENIALPHCGLFSASIGP